MQRRGGEKGEGGGELVVTREGTHAHPPPEGGSRRGAEGRAAVAGGRRIRRHPPAGGAEAPQPALAAPAVATFASPNAVLAALVGPAGPRSLAAPYAPLTTIPLPNLAGAGEHEAAPLLDAWRSAGGWGGGEGGEPFF